MAEWGRKEYSKKWPSRTPVWTWLAIFASFVFFAGMLTLEYERSWTAAERLYLSDYLKSGARGKASATAASKYTLLEAVVGPGQSKGQRLVIGDEIEPVPELDGRLGYRLTDEGVKDGIARLTWVTATFNDRGLNRLMGQAVYSNHQAWEFYQKPVYLSLEWMKDPELRRRVQVGLNKGEARNALARAVFFNRQGDLRDRSFENQRYRASGLNLIVAAITLWNTVYFERAINALRGHGIAIDDESLAHLSPIGWEHINLTGDYTWQATSRLRKGSFRPLRPFAASNE